MSMLEMLAEMGVTVIHVSCEPKSEPACSCQMAAGPWEALDCPVHGEAAEKELERLHESEMLAESAWLRASESSMEDCPEWAR